MSKQRIAVIGCGVWGRNIVTSRYNVGALDTVCEMEEYHLKMGTDQYKGVNVTKD